MVKEASAEPAASVSWSWWKRMHWIWPMRRLRKPSWCLMLETIVPSYLNTCIAEGKDALY